MHNQRYTRLFGNVQNFLFHLKVTELSILPLTLVVLSPKQFSSDEKQKGKKAFREANVHTLCISCSLSQNSLSRKKNRQQTEKPALSLR